MNYRAVLFDLGNTLLVYAQAGRWREFCLERLEEMHPLVCETLGRPAVPAGEFAARVDEVIGRRGKVIEDSGRSWHFAERLREGLAAVGLRADGDSLSQLTDAFYEPIRACTKPYPDTRETLESLKGLGMGLAVVTNSPWDTPTRLLRGDLERWGLADFFEAFVCSGELPWRKPNPEFMWQAGRELGVEPEACLVAGDSLAADVAGARAARMTSAWVNREGAVLPPDGPQPDHVAKSLLEVLGILKGRTSPPQRY